MDVLIAALSRLDPLAAQWRCTIAGNGDIDRWRHLAQTAGVGDYVVFTGWVTSDDVRALACEADIMVLPSRAEALPLSLIEGASAGVALVATDIGAVCDIVVDGRNGMVVERNADALGAALAQLLAKPELRAEMQAQSRHIYLERFGMDRYATSILDALKETARPT